MLTSIISHLIVIVGFTVCVATGLAVAGFIINMAASYMWRNAKAAYSMGYLLRTAKIIHRRQMIKEGRK
ncbi:MAG: hypothetical protein ACTIOQ_23605 [Serratia grimesii]|uniref:hypothetical protein n=1 Tax=Serratia grimesii TaxID=82995 RepID=UPI003F9DFD15